VAVEFVKRYGKIVP